MKLLFENWREYLSEITRYEKETGKKSFGKYDITKYVTNTDPVKYAFTMVRQEKVGLNPKTKYNTPAGVYFYPLNQEYYNKLVKDELPFASMHPYVGVVRLEDVDTDKWLKFINAGTSHQPISKVVEAMKEIGLSPSPGYPGSERLELPPHQIDAKLNHWGFNNDAKIFDMTWWKAHRAPQGEYGPRPASNKPTFTWNKQLRDLGYIGIYDSNNSIIHPDEPWQAVALSPKAYKIVAFYSVADIRKADFPTSSIKRIELAGKPGLPKKIYQKLVETGEDQAIIVLISNPSVSKEIFEFISNNNPSVVVKIALANNSRTPLDILRKLSKEGGQDPTAPSIGWGSSMSDSAIKRAVAKNPNTTEDILTALASHNSIAVRAAVAENHKTQAEALRKIIKHPEIDAMVIDKVAKNPNIPKDLWDLIIKHENITYDGYLRLARSPQAPPEILKRLATQKLSAPPDGRDLHLTIARNPRAPPEILKHFADVKGYTFQKAIAGNPNTPPEVLEKMMGQNPLTVLAQHHLAMRIIKNPRAPLKLITDLIKSPDAHANAKLFAWNIIKKKYGQGEISLTQLNKAPFTDEDFKSALSKLLNQDYDDIMRPASGYKHIVFETIQKNKSRKRPIRIVIGNKKL
jgi:hypothetical protein